MRVERTIFEVTFSTTAIGKRKHLILADDWQAAQVRLKRAYPSQDINLHDMREQIWIYDTGSSRRPFRGKPRSKK
ncbi:hypothetical protein RA27_22480 [Ruegeria sp. ANG-R]|nr:hypothetical protein RA27_22480 [Ruegeria sp. ANG-R]